MMHYRSEFSTVYAHNLQNIVEVGDIVEAGAVIALASVMPDARADRTCTFEIRRDGMAYNPVALLTARDQQPAPAPGEMAAVYPASETGDEDAGE